VTENAGEEEEMDKVGTGKSLQKVVEMGAADYGTTEAYLRFKLARNLGA
jgi:hypothetical protein